LISGRSVHSPRKRVRVASGRGLSGSGSETAGVI
jgi:hypothetical protein